MVSRRSDQPPALIAGEPTDRLYTVAPDSLACDVDDGRICKSNNAEEKTLRCVAWGRKAWLFASSDRGAGRATSMLMLITITRTNDVAPRVWLAADIITGIAILL